MYLLYSLYISLTLVSTLMSDENRSFPSGESIIPQKLDFSGVPTFISDLKKRERIKNEYQQSDTFKKIVEKITHANQEQLDSYAHELAHQPEELEHLLQNFPQAAKNSFSSDDSSMSQRNEEEKEFLLQLKQTNLEGALNLLNTLQPFIFRIESTPCQTSQTITIKEKNFENTLQKILAAFKQTYYLENNTYCIIAANEQKSALTQCIQSLITINHAPFNEAFKERVESFWNLLHRPKTNNEWIHFDERTKKIFCYASPEKTATLKAYIFEIDSPPPQVLIEARIVITSKDFEESLGLQWSHLYNRRASIKHGLEYVGSGPLDGLSNSPSPQPLSSLMDWAFNLFPDTGVAGRSIHVPFVFGGNDLSTKRLNLVLNAAENRDELKTILKPTLLTSHGEEAEILVGQNVPIETEVKETIEGTLRDITTATYKDVGTKLKIKPFISPDKKTVILDLYVENSSQQLIGKFPLITTTRSKNKIMLKNAQTTMIGGLIENTAQRSENAVPFISKLPLIGWLFRGHRRKKTDQQMIIFITSTIL